MTQEESPLQAVLPPVCFKALELQPSRVPPGWTNSLPCWGSLGTNTRTSPHHVSFFTLQTGWTQVVPDITTPSTIRAVPCHSRTPFGRAHLSHLPRCWNSFLSTSTINLAQGHGGAAWLQSPFAETLLFYRASLLGRCLSSYMRQVNNFHHVKFMIAAPAASCHRTPCRALPV